MGFEKCSVQTAVARRVVGALWEMETICAVPEGVRCVSFGGLGGSDGVDVEDLLGGKEEWVE